MGQFKYSFILILHFIAFNASANSVLPELEKARDKVFEVFQNEIHPRVTSAYKAYDSSYGQRISQATSKTYEKLAPDSIQTAKEVNDFLYSANPEFFNELHKIPSPLKIVAEEILYVAWGSMYIARELTTGKPTDLGSYGHIGINNFKVRAGILKAPPYIQRRLDKLLNDIRNNSGDIIIGDCLKVHAVPVPYEAAFNSGCNIFIYEGMYKSFSDAQLRAVIAHEISHSVNGDALKTLAYITKAALHHTSKLTIEEISWLAMNEQMEYLNKTGSQGNFKTMMEHYNRDMQHKEVLADIHGVRILNAAGFSGNDAISAVKIGEGIKENEEPKIYPINLSEQHPPGYIRINAIKKAMRF